MTEAWTSRSRDKQNLKKSKMAHQKSFFMFLRNFLRIKPRNFAKTHPVFGNKHWLYTKFYGALCEIYFNYIKVIFGALDITTSFKAIEHKRLTKP